MSGEWSTDLVIEAKKIVLAVHLEEHEMTEFRKTKRHCCEPESEASLIKSFCCSTRKFAYSEPFVSIAVYRPEEDIWASAATIYGDSTALRKNCYVILKADRVLPDIDTAAQDDFRQLAVQVAKRWKNREPYDSLLRQVEDLRTMTAEQKADALFLSTLSRGQHGYSEARLNRCLTPEDVQDWRPCP